MSRTSRARCVVRHRDSGAVTVEAAIALCGFVAILALVLAGLSAVLDQIRCTDAAQEAARLVARGEDVRAKQVGAAIAPRAASVIISTDADTAVVTVTVNAAGGLLPGVDLRAQAYTVLEPQPLNDLRAVRAVPKTDNNPPGLADGAAR